MTKFKSNIFIPLASWIISLVFFFYAFFNLDKDKPIYLIICLITLIIGLVSFSLILIFLDKKHRFFLSKINNLSSYVWFTSTISFIIVILLSTKGLTKDPCYSPGCSEEGYLLPMIGSLFLGFFSFLFTLLTGLLRIIARGEKIKPLFNFGSIKVGFLTFFIAGIFTAYFMGVIRGGSFRIGEGYTAFDILRVVNEHRKSNGINELKLSEELCDNIVSRWKAIKEGKQHEGFAEWVEKEGIQKIYGYKDLVELYIIADSPKDALDFWLKSPSHKLQIENKKWKDVCVYSNEKITVMIMGYK